MYVVVRRYSGASGLSDALAGKPQEVEDLLKSIPGFVAYYGLRDGGSVTTITVCEDRAGTEESTRRAAEWVKENLSGVSMGAPEVTEGEVFLQFGR